MFDAEYYRNSNVTIIEESNYTKGVGLACLVVSPKQIWEYEDLMGLLKWNI